MNPANQIRCQEILYASAKPGAEGSRETDSEFVTLVKYSHAPEGPSGFIHVY